MRYLVTLTLLLFGAGLLWGGIGAFSALPDSLVRFAGSEAVRVVGDTISVTYLIPSASHPGYSDWVFVRSVDNGQSFARTVIRDNLEDFGDALPTLEVSDFRTFVFYDQYFGYSDDGGTQFILRNPNWRMGSDVPARIWSQSVYSLQPTGRTLDPGSFSLFYNENTGPTGYPIYFVGPDSIDGRVHVNDDIYVKSVYGLPWFGGFVSYVGMFLTSGAGCGEEDVFTAGYEGGSAYMKYGDVNPGLLDEDFAGIPDSTDIVYVIVNGSTYESYLADVVPAGIDTLTIYDCYPPFGPVGDSIGVNYIPRYDTLWTVGPSGTSAGQRIRVPCDLWIRGTIAGDQTWYTGGNAWIVGNLLYQDTPVGSPPDGMDHGTLVGEVNETDYLTLVADKQIIIKYGFVDPVTMHRVRCSLGDVYLYGHFVAMHRDEDPFDDGAITFEYQHPHRSTPDTYFQGEWYRDVDLHLAKYPPDGVHLWPWPAGSDTGFHYPASYGTSAWPDYPYYNPLWPEISPYLERGTLHIWGSMASERRGYIHRGHFDTSEMGTWDPEHHMYGQNTEGLGFNINNGLNNTGCGYVKLFKADLRLASHSNPVLSRVRTQQDFDNPAYRLSKHSYLYPNPQYIHDFLINGTADVFAFDNLGNRMIALIHQTDGWHLGDSDSGGMLWEETVFPGDEVADVSLCVTDTVFFSLQEGVGGTTRVFRWDSVDSTPVPLGETDPALGSGTFLKTGKTVFTCPGMDGQITFSRIRHDELEEVYRFDTGFGDGLVACGAVVNRLDSVYVLVQDRERPFSPWGRLYLAHGTLPEPSGAHDVAPARPEPELTLAPNPFNPDLTLRFSLPEPQRVRLDVYNLRGQHVARIADDRFPAGDHALAWSGVDGNGRPQASGVYLVRMEAGETVLTARALLMK